MRYTAVFVVLLAGLVLSPAQADLRLDLDTISIEGNPEIPHVVYLTAWRKSPKGDILQQTLESLHSTDINPIDRDVFRRQINYHHLMEQLHDQQN